MPKINIMKKLLSSIVLSIISICTVYAQGIIYQKNLDEAIAQASKSNKPIFVYLSSPMPVGQNVPANLHFNNSTGLDDKKVAEYFNKKFICFHPSTADSAGLKFSRKYQVTLFPTYIFLDQKGEMFYKDSKNSIDPERYMSMAGEVVGRFAANKTISYYAQLDKQGSITQQQLKEYISLKESLGLYDNAALINEYVNSLTIKSFDDYQDVLFILEAGPYAYGKVYNLAFTNRKITDSIFKKESGALQAAIFNRIINNTENEAIRTKNVAMAQNAASYVRSLKSRNYKDANQWYSFELMKYYWEVKDTTQYYRSASSYYDTYFLSISADSAKKLQQNVLENLKKRSSRADTVIQRTKDNTIRQMSVIRSFGPESSTEQKNGSTVANALNTAAWDFYTLGTHNTDYLIKALVWSKRSIELQPNYAYYDTIAHIMYRLEFYEEAVVNQNKAIELAANEQRVSQTEKDKLKAELAKMQAHKL